MGIDDNKNNNLSTDIIYVAIAAILLITFYFFIQYGFTNENEIQEEQFNTESEYTPERMKKVPTFGVKQPSKYNRKYNTFDMAKERKHVTLD